ncbi:MAG: DNA mismatch repair protein MutS, partial [Eudoraea sp.]|nr:DNA mismatch repair protein MutS [Eudoraea sp.]
MFKKSPIIPTFTEHPIVSMHIPAKTLADLEFPEVLEQLAARCITEAGAEAATKIGPIKEEELILNSLGKTKEYLDSFELDTVIPNHGFDALDDQLSLLGIENTSLEVDGFRRILSICQTGTLHLKFFKKQKLIYPLWAEETAKLEDAKHIIEEIKMIIDRFGEIRDDASQELKDIRKNIQNVRSKLNQSFTSALNRYKAQDYLDEIRESTVDNKRVLAVKAMYRKKVKGSVLGSSKTGSIVFIEPDAVMQHSRTLNNLIFDEQEEIRRILKALTEYVRPFAPVLVQYVTFLTQMDICSAKAKYAKELNAVLPKINEEKKLYLKDAYHPLLYLSNKQNKEKTWPQSLEFHPE